MAFAINDDHEAQNNVLEKLKNWQGAHEIKRLLTKDDMSSTDKRVKFVGMKAYEKAGGTLKRDLFSENGKDTYIENTDLLNKLLAEKLEKSAIKIQKEGWK